MLDGSDDWRKQARRSRTAVMLDRAKARLLGHPPPGPPGPIAMMRDAMMQIEDLVLGPPGMMPRILSRPWSILMLGIRHGLVAATLASAMVLGGLMLVAVIAGDDPAFHAPVMPGFVAMSDVLAVSVLGFAVIWATLATPARHLAHGLDDRDLDGAMAVLQRGAGTVRPALRDALLRDARSRVERRLRWWFWAAAALWASTALAMREASGRPDDASVTSAAVLLGITLAVWIVAVGCRAGALRILCLADLASAALAGERAGPDP